MCDVTKGKIPVKVYDNKQQAFEAMADMMVDTIVANNKAGKKTLFIVPVGPVGQYPYFVEKVNSQSISLKDVTFINMDEYMASETELIGTDNKLSFRKFMHEEVYGKIYERLIMPECQRIFPSPTNRVVIEEVIAKHGGVDVCFGGIGINGHMAFNEPPEAEDKITEKQFCDLSVRVQKISRETKVVNGLNEFDGAYYLMPDYCVTIGMKQILNAKKVRLFVFRDWHKSVVRRAVLGEKSMYFPASLLQGHPDACIGLTKELL